MFNKQLVVLINGPINSGKDTLGELLAIELVRLGIDTKLSMFKEELYTMASKISSIPRDEFVRQASDRFDKEEPWYKLPQNSATGLYFTPRQWLIHVSENVLKPLVGKTVFGKSALQNTIDPFFETYKSGVVIMTDCGFTDEVDEVRKVYKEITEKTIFEQKNTILVRITRPGTSFANDSRNWIDNPDYTIDNRGTLEDLEDSAKALALMLKVILGKGDVQDNLAISMELMKQAQGLMND